MHERRPGAAGVRTAVYVRGLDRGPARRLPGGTVNDDDRTGVSGLDLDARRLAIAWRTAGPAGQGIPYGTAELLVDRLDGGEQTIVTRLVNTYLDYGGVATPELAGGRLRYGLIWVNEGGTTIGDLTEYDLTRGTRTSQRLPDRVAGVAVSGRETYVVRCNPEWMMTPGCDVSVRETAAGADPDVELTRSERATPVSWYRRWVAYSVYDAAAGYRLTLGSAEGAVVQPSVPPRPVPFDVDLGPGPDGSLAAVYSRCRGPNCDIYRYDTVRRREVRVTRSAASELLPAVEGSRIVFVRRDGGRASVESLDGRRLAGPRRARVRALDLRGRRVAVAWGRRPPWEDLDAWSDFVRRLARRHREHRFVWDVWNEPDHPYFWNGTQQQFHQTCAPPTPRCARSSGRARSSLVPARPRFAGTGSSACSSTAGRPTARSTR